LASVAWNQWLTPSPTCAEAGLIVAMSVARRSISSRGEPVISTTVSRS